MQKFSKQRILRRSDAFPHMVSYILFFIAMIVTLSLIIANGIGIVSTVGVSIFIIGLCIFHAFLAKDTFTEIACLLNDKYKIEYTKVSSIRKPFPVSHVGDGVMVLEIEGGRTIGTPYLLAQQLSVADDIVIIFVEGITYPAVIAKPEWLMEEIDEAKRESKTTLGE